MTINERNRMTVTAIAAEAQNAHLQYPQYTGHWQTDDWVLVRFTRKVKTKLGVAFLAGDVTIARQTDDEFPTAYSRRNRIDTSVKHTDYEVIWD